MTEIYDLFLKKAEITQTSKGTRKGQINTANRRKEIKTLIFLFIKSYNDTDKNKYPIIKLCDIFKVSKSGFYKFFSKKKGKRELQNEIILNEIYKIKNNEISNFSKCYGVVLFLIRLILV